MPDDTAATPNTSAAVWSSKVSPLVHIAHDTVQDVQNSAAHFVHEAVHMPDVALPLYVKVEFQRLRRGLWTGLNGGFLTRVAAQGQDGCVDRLKDVFRTLAIVAALLIGVGTSINIAAGSRAQRTKMLVTSDSSPAQI